jgi:pyruvate/2-oxoglutarate dehydrogenase complex dihydrolipoamide acyltransferase (E2) component
MRHRYAATMTEGSVTAWLKKGELLFVVETDKTETEVESMGSTYLTAVRVELGQMVSVGTVIATLSDQPINPRT